MIEKAVLFLEKRRAINLFLVLLYMAAIIGLHDFMVQQSIIMMNYVGLENYNKYVAYISVFIAIIIISFLAFHFYKDPTDRVKKGFYLFTTLILMASHFHFMFEMNIEIIHSLQYGVLGILLFPLSRKIGLSAILSLPIMLIDEWYQYQILYPGYVEYFEFNDIIMNILGLALFSTILWIGGAHLKTYSIANILKHLGLKIISLYIIITILLLITGIVVLYPEQADNSTWLILNTVKSKSFWVIHKFTKAQYHILRPIESFFGILLLFVFYLGLDFRFKKESGFE